MSSAATIKILRAMGELNMLGNKEHSMQTICLFSGYGHPKSTPFAKGLRKLRLDGMINAGSTKGTLRLTEHGIRALPSDMEPPRDTEQVHIRLRKFLSEKMATNTDKLDQLWTILGNGKVHAVADLAKALGYGHVKSTSFVVLIRRLKELGVADSSKGKIQLTDMAFPMGRP